jgi:pathogenesis-related protein 1
MRQLLLVAALLVALFNTVLSVGSAAVMDEALAAHNAIRRQVAQAESQRLGGTVSIPDLAWDPALSALAQDWANQVVGPNPPPHRPADQRPGIGENIFWSYSIGAPVNQSIAAAMQFWASEQQYYDYDTNSCAAGQVCGHYTQVVWSTTTLVGCGSALWNAGGAEYVVWVCNYWPAGNLTINGEELRPYNVSAAPAPVP